MKCNFVEGQECMIPGWWVKNQPCKCKVVRVYRHEPDNRWEKGFILMTVQPLEGNPHQRSVPIDIETGNVDVDPKYGKIS